MSQFLVEKRRVAVLTLSSGVRLNGCFFLAGPSAAHAEPKRVVDLLNSEEGLFPFETRAACDTC